MASTRTWTGWTGRSSPYCLRRIALACRFASRVGLTPTPCWKRIRRMEQAGVILRRVAVIDPAKVGLPVSVFVAVETADHSSEWLKRFAAWWPTCRKLSMPGG